MRLILKDYIETLKEEKELEALLENILLMNDFTDIVRPQKGVTQHGVDFSAQKDGQIYLFVLKQKNIDKTNWNAGNNAVRPTLDEIVDVYIPQYLNNCRKKVNIIVCTNGIIKQNVKADWDGYINRNSSAKRKYKFWGIDELTKYTEQVLLNEYLFNNELKSDLRKTLYFSEEDTNFTYYNELVVKLKSRINILEKGKKTYKKSLIIYALIVKMCIYYASEKNSKMAQKMSERALLVLWYFIMENNLYGSDEEVGILSILMKQYEACCRKYVKDIMLVYKYEPSFPIYNSVEYRITIYEVIGMLASYTYYLYYYYGNTVEVRNNINTIITLINNNVSFYYPLYDLNSIEINTLFFLLNEVGNNQLEVLLEGIIGKIISRMRLSNYYPVEGENYDKVLQIEFNEDVEECGATVLLTNLIEWMNVLKKDKLKEKIIKYLYDKFPNITFNTVEIDITEEAKYFKGDMYNSVVAYVIDYNCDNINIEEVYKKINEDNKMNKYAFYEYSAVPFLFIAARNYRLPLPSNIINKNIFAI